MTQAAFTRRLSALFEQFLVEGGDPWWLSREVSDASMEVLDQLRCGLVEADSEGEHGL